MQGSDTVIQGERAIKVKRERRRKSYIGKEGAKEIGRERLGTKLPARTR
jgi:hypothetical protein